VDSATAAEIIAKGKKLSEGHYNMLWAYLTIAGGQLWYAHNLTHPDGALVLPPTAKHPSEFHLNGDTFSCRRSHQANSSIQFYTATGTTNMGFIEVIWQLPLEGHMRTFLLVRPHKPLPLEQEQKAPFHNRPRFYTKIMDAGESPDSALTIIEPRHIITHTVVYKRPAASYHTQMDILVVCWALNRGRKEI
jgi:hypothetical protein